MVLALAIATIAVFLYLKSQPSYVGTVPVPLVVGFVLIYLAGFHVAKHLLKDAGKVAITLGREGVKFDRYPLIRWSDIDEIYVVEDSDGPSSLWLSIKEGVTFLPDGPRPLIWLAKVSGLHRSIDISGYGSFSMPDTEIQRLLEEGLQQALQPTV